MQEATSLVLRTSTGLTALAILLRLHALTPPPSLCRSQSLGLERHSSLLLRNHYLVKKLRFLFCPVQNTLFFLDTLSFPPLAPGRPGPKLLWQALPTCRLVVENRLWSKKDQSPYYSPATLWSCDLCTHRTWPLTLPLSLCAD